MTELPIWTPKGNLRCAPDVGWIAEPDCIRVVSAARGLTIRLAYPEAALWDFLVRGFSPARATGMIRHVGGFADDETAARFVVESIGEWQRLSLIVTDSR